MMKFIVGFLILVLIVMIFNEVHDTTVAIAMSGLLLLISMALIVETQVKTYNSVINKVKIITNVRDGKTV
jgi:uncharacterized membrane protein